MSNPMNSPLWVEYKQLAEAFEHNQSYNFMIPPLVVPAILGFTVFDKVNAHLFGFTLPIAINFVMIWLGFSHSLINYYGLLLVEIEQRLNLQLEEDDPNRLSFYTNYVAGGLQNVFGLLGYWLLVGIMFLIAYVLSLLNSWHVMIDWQWGMSKIIVLVSLIVFPLIVIFNFFHVEYSTKRKKNECCLRYSQLRKAAP